MACFSAKAFLSNMKFSSSEYVVTIPVLLVALFQQSEPQQFGGLVQTKIFYVYKFISPQ